MADINHPVKKSLSTILEAARADDSRLLKPIQSSRFLPIYVDFRPLTVTKGMLKATDAIPHDKQATTRAKTACNGRKGARPSRAVPALSAKCKSVSTQVMAEWYPRDEAGAYHRMSSEGVPSAWAEGMVSLIQLMIHEQGMTPVDDRETIKRHMFRRAVNQHSLVSGPDRRTRKPSAQQLQKHASDGRQWNRHYGAMLKAGHTPARLADANDEAVQKGFLQALPDLAGGTDREEALSGSEQTCTEDRPLCTRKRIGRLQASKRPADEVGVGRDTYGGKQRAAPANDSHQTTAGSCEVVEEDADGQSQGSPKRRKAQPSSQHEKQDRPAMGPGHVDAAEVAGQGHVLAKYSTGDGGQVDEDLNAEELCVDVTSEGKGQGATCPSTHEHEQQACTPVIAGAASPKRKSMADPDEGEAQLGLNSSYNSEEPEATKLFCAKLFWAGEELMDVGGGRFYPSRFVREVGDMPLQEWIHRMNSGSMPFKYYEVVAIVDERKCLLGMSSDYVVKFKGFELNAEQWLPQRALPQPASNRALCAWAQKLAVGGPWQAFCQALSAFTSMPSAGREPP